MSLLARNRLIGLVMAAGLFVADQGLKALVMGPLQLARRDAIALLPFFDLRFTRNYGVSLGMLTANSEEMRWILVAITALIAFGVLVWMMREKAMADIAALALVLGGALGNIRDRWINGYVIDYADFHIGAFRPFLIFNLADAAITIGVLIILARSFFLREKHPEQKRAPEPAPEPEDTAQSPAEI